MEDSKNNMWLKQYKYKMKSDPGDNLSTVHYQNTHA